MANSDSRFKIGLAKENHIKYLFYPELGPSHFFFFFVFCLFRAVPLAYGGSQARGLIGAVDAGLRHGYDNVRSEPHL